MIILMASNDSQSFDVVELLSLFALKTMSGSSKAISLKTRHKDTYTQWHSADDKENKKTWQVNMNMKTWQVNMNMKTWQVKQDLWKVWPAALIISAMKTVFPHLGSPLLLVSSMIGLHYYCCCCCWQGDGQSHLGQISAPPHFGFGFGPPDPGALGP